MTILKEFETKNEISNAGIAISSCVLSINDDEDLKKMTKKEYSNAMKILRKRFASGEITREDFIIKKKVIEE